MAGSGGSYNASVQMGEGTAISNSAVTYSNGTLTSTDNSAKNTEFTSPTGKPGTNLSGKLLLSYPDGDSTPIYNPGDIAVINALIENNGMVGTETELADGSYAPDDWGGVEWSAADTNKRVIGLRIDGQPIDGAYGEADVRGLAALERLDCYANKLTRLNVSGLASLQSIYCGNNRLASLDLSGLDALRELECYGNRLTALDLSGLDSLEDFYGNGQTASLTLYSNGGGYASRAAMGDGAAFGNSALSYDRSAGMLTSTNRKAGSSTFTSPTGQKDFALTGTLTLKYTDKTAPTADGVLDYRLEAQPGEGDITYNGDPRPILCGAKEGVVGLGTITVYYEGTSGTVYEKSDIPPANAGTYAVSVDIAEGDSYTAASGIQLGIYVIAKAPGTFPPLVNRTAVLKAALRLADIALPQGYAWDAPNTAITNIGNGQPFPATYTDPSGNYTAASGTVAVNVTDRETSTPGAVGTDIAKASVAVAGPAAWTGRQVKPKVTVKLGGRTLTAGKDYTVSYGANKNIGKGSVTVKGAGNYAGAKTAAFKILPQKVKLSKIKPAQKRIKVTWKKAKAAQKLTGYQIRYRAPGGKWKTKTVPAKKKELTIKGLAKGKKYRVQIRAYKKIGKEKYASPWSATKKSRRVR
jgi:hypothetical protein